jgi:hypothetical protein
MRMLRAVLVSLLVAAAVVLRVPAPSFAQVGISITIAPPVLPVYVQPPIPAPGYLWTPGYWAWGPDGYYWVPGTWVLPPTVGLLWTPGYWGWGGAAFLFHAGYWGPTVGFYGGINYGFGYGGVGFGGGYWSNGQFNYNRAVTNISNTRITNVYNRNVTVNRVTNVSYNGGAGGIAARPTPAEIAAEREHHVAPTPVQVQHQQTASSNRALLASVNHGNPAVAATARPGEFTGRGVVAAHGAPAAAGAERRPPAGAERRPPAGAGQRPVAGTEHRPPATAAERPRPAHPGQAPQEHRPAAPGEHPAAPQREMHQLTPQQRAAQQRAAQQRAAQQRAAQQRPAHPPAAHPPAAHEPAEHRPQQQ